MYVWIFFCWSRLHAVCGSQRPPARARSPTRSHSHTYKRSCQLLVTHTKPVLRFLWRWRATRRCALCARIPVTAMCLKPWFYNSILICVGYMKPLSHTHPFEEECGRRAGRALLFYIWRLKYHLIFSINDVFFFFFLPPQPPKFRKPALVSQNTLTHNTLIRCVCEHSIIRDINI